MKYVSPDRQFEEERIRYVFNEIEKKRFNGIMKRVDCRKMSFIYGELFGMT